MYRVLEATVAYATLICTFYYYYYYYHHSGDGQRAAVGRGDRSQDSRAVKPISAVKWIAEELSAQQTAARTAECDWFKEQSERNVTVVTANMSVAVNALK